MTTEISEELPNKALLLPREVALVLRISIATVYRWCDEGLLDAGKTRGCTRITRESVLSRIKIMFDE